MSIRQLADEADAIAAYAHDLAAGELLLTVLGDTPAVRAESSTTTISPTWSWPSGTPIPRAWTSPGNCRSSSAPDRRESLTADNLATAIRSHLRTRTSSVRPALVAGLIADATVGLSDPEMVTAIRKRYELIEQRADTLAADAMNSGEPWTSAIPASISNDRRMAVVRILATYRERWDITGPAPLGKRPDEFAHSVQHADHQRLSDMLRRLAVDARPRPDPALDQSARRSGRTL